MSMEADVFYYFLAGIIGGTLLSLVGVGLAAAIIMPGIDHWNRRFFITLFIILALIVIAFTADVFVFDHPELILAEKIIIYFEFFLVSLLMPMFTLFLLHVCHEPLRRSKLFGSVVALWIVFFLFLLIAQFTTFFQYVTPKNQYARGPWFSLFLAPLAVIMLLNLAGVWRRKGKMSRKYHAASLIYLLPMTIALLLHMFIDAIVIFDIALTISALSMFVIILTEQIEQYMLQQRELAHQQSKVMLLQMRPHFIYNSMTSIYYLCELDPRKAQQVTKDFTVYLRKNFTAMASDETIPFSDELEHTRAYLAVEQAQFDDSLFVDYDTPHIRFRVPPLTLQPIVENAVKHGMDPESGPLHIVVRTRETESGNEILVEDDGTGFDPAGHSSPYTALENIQQRLEFMCKGELTIMPREGGGTIVKVIIPEQLLGEKAAKKPDFLDKSIDESSGR